MRILYITDAFIYPLTSGYLRHYHFIKKLSEQHEIFLFSIVDASFREEYREAVQPITTEVVTFFKPSKTSFWRRQFKRMRNLVSMDKTIQEMQQAIQSLMESKNIDVILLAGQETYRAIEDISTIPIVADLCDAASKRTKKQLQYASLSERLYLWLKVRRIQRFEQDIINNVKYVLFASDRDSVIVTSQWRDKIVILPNGVDLDYWQRSSRQLGQHTIIFTGAMLYPPNEDAAIVLINEIVPLVRQTIPDLNVLIVGHSPTDELKALGTQENINVTGFVEDMRPYLEQATLFVAPIRFGSGIQNKVLEAMAMELPVIASPLVVDGFIADNRSQPPIMVAEKAEDFAKQIIQHLLDSENDLTPDASARQFVSEHFSWDQHSETLSTLLSNLKTAKN